MEETREIKPIVKKLNMIYKRGYIPKRESMKYSYYHACAVNCFGHACFNLSNNDLKKLEPYLLELHDYFRDFSSTKHSFIEEAKNRITNVGLKVEKSSLSETIQKNQWKIAYYVKNDEFTGRDLHFMIQGKDGSWLSKIGSNSEIEIFKNLPNEFRDKYYLSGIYKITNPYVKIKDDEGVER